MKSEGWTWNDFAGELMARGIDPDEVEAGYLMEAMHERTAEQAAQTIEELSKD